jgi:hypothetical protein
MLQSVIRYDACNYGNGGNIVEPLGFDKTTTFDRMIAVAIENNCSVIIKNGKGKWYLKAQNTDYELVKERLEANKGKSPGGRMCWLIKYD